MIRASLVRALIASAVLAGALALAGCDTDGVYQLPTRAMKALSPAMVALLDQKNMPKDSPILVRIFKEESELEVWKQDTTGLFQLLKVYPICRWSGDLGPKVHEGDRQAPEGFYAITPELMNPNSNYYLAINTGFPNAYDKANGRSGAFLMIHGDCSSRGCYAMTDEQIGEIYSLARESFLGGQQSFQIQAYPFRMTAANFARHRTNPNMPFWKMIKEGNDHFEVTHLEPKVDVCDRHYVFDATPPGNSTKPLVFTPAGRCPAFVVAQDIAGPVQAKQQNDEAQYALFSRTMPAAPIRTGLDGGMNRVFLAQTNGSIPPARVPPTGLPPQPPAVTADNSGGPTFASRLFGGLFGSKPAAEQTRVASTDSGSRERGTGSRGSEPAVTGTAASQRTQNAAHNETAAAAGSRPKANEPRNAAPRKGEETAAAKPKPDPQQEANAAAPPAKTGALLTGAQPVVPAGSFDSRWGGLQ
ncbi:MAG TPA: murein L,D-transpeptidase family protein [Xanthobacteraceae bacterium]|nr:murein L,D-transpeptidase family protein [Xanthobacteraceae bacterium]